MRPILSPIRAREHLLRIVSLIRSNPPDWNTLVLSSRPFLVTFVNPLSIYTCIRNPDFLGILERFDVVLSDGMLLAKIAQRVRLSTVERVSFDGNSAAPGIFEACAAQHRSIYFVGGPDDVAARAALLFRERFNIRVAGTRSGHFATAAERHRALETIAAAAPDVVVAGMGSYLQERFLLDLVEVGWRGLGFTCGAYLEQASRYGISYYPDFINRTQLRALFRIRERPGRMINRYILHYFPFYLAAFSVVVNHPTRAVSAAPRE